ncbi:MAG: trimethylamine methyltransferase family protein [Anaerolineales bacterium]|jgi:trimethylamine--corrinoid protein Co-methyltransferase
MSNGDNGRRKRLSRRGHFTPLPPGLEGGQYRPLSEASLQRIHQASLEVLEHTGVEVEPSETREIFRAAGARMDEERQRVYLSRELVEWALSSAPRSVTLCGRDPQRDIILGGRRVHMGTGGAAIKILDLESQQVRRTTLSDVALIGRLVDNLDNIHFYLRACVAHDVPVELLDINTYYAAITNTTKHVTGNCYRVDTARQVIEMASMIAGSLDALRQRPFISVTSSWMISPLRFATETTQVLTEVVRQGLPVFLSSAPQAGATSPAALAGTLVQINAEELAGLTYTQLVKPGAPVVLGYVPSVSDLRTGNYVGGSAEFGLMNAAAAQLSQFYDLPIYNSSGLTDSKIPDAQAGYEKGITGTLAALAGSNYIHHSAGFLESMLTVAYEQYVIDDDINGSIMRAVRGIEVNDESLSVELIDEVCRGAGHYLGTQQSLERLYSEYYYPHEGDRQRRQGWEDSGSLDERERARRKARRILQEHRPVPIPAEVDAAIRSKFNILLPEDLANVEKELRRMP